MVTHRNLHISHSRQTILLAIILSVMLIVSVYAYIVSLPPYESPRASITSPPLEFSMELNKLEFLQAENFTVELVLKNIGNQSVTLVWPDGYVFDFVVKDVNETLVYNWGGEHVYPLMVINIALDIGQNMTWGFTWHQKLVADHWVYPKGLIPKGTYYVKGIVRPFDLHVESQVTLIGISLETPSITFIVR